MGGAIIQLVAFGSQNIYVTGQPQITFWKSVYRRYTNFSMESIQQDIKGNVAPGNYVSTTISRNGDLLKNLYVQYNPQSIYNVPILFENGGIPSNLGNSLLKEIELEIGGQIIDRQYGIWLTIWNDLTSIKYISPAPPVDTFGEFGATGVEPSVSPLYNRMSYNHNQQNTQFDLNLKTACLGTEPLDDECSLILKFPTFDLLDFNGDPIPTVFPTSGTFDMTVLNYNNYPLFNTTDVYNLYFKIGLNYYIVSVTSIDYSVTDQITFQGCAPTAPTVYPGSSFVIPEGTEVFQAFQFLNPLSDPNYNILTQSGFLEYAQVGPNVNDEGYSNCYYTVGEYIIITFSGDIYNMTLDAFQYYNGTGPNGNLGFSPSTCSNPPVSDINLDGIAYCIFTDVQSFENPNLNVLPTSGTFDLNLYSYVNLYSPVKQLPDEGLFVITVGGIEYYIHYTSFIQPYYQVTQLINVYLFNNCTLINYPTTPVEIPQDITEAYFSFYSYTLFNAPTEAYIPLQFWFCKNPGLALPLIALQYHEVKINFLLSTFQELHATQLTSVNLSSIKLYGEYIFLDTVERRLFSQNVHEYLIEQVQYQVYNNSFSSNLSGGELQIDLNFSNPVKELIFCGSPNVYGIYSQGLSTPTSMLTDTVDLSNVTLQLTINQISRFSPRNLKYFTRNQIWDCHSGSGSCNSVPSEVDIDNIGVYSFSLKPEDHQPSGTCNFSRIINPRLVFSNFNTLEQLKPINIYAVNYNVFRILSGMGSLVYVN